MQHLLLKTNYQKVCVSAVTVIYAFQISIDSNGGGQVLGRTTSTILQKRGHIVSIPRQIPPEQLMLLGHRQAML